MLDHCNQDIIGNVGSLKKITKNISSLWEMYSFHNLKIDNLPQMYNNHMSKAMMGTSLEQLDQGSSL